MDLECLVRSQAALISELRTEVDALKMAVGKNQRECLQLREEMIAQRTEMEAQRTEMDHLKHAVKASVSGSSRQVSKYPSFESSGDNPPSPPPGVRSGGSGKRAMKSAGNSPMLSPTNSRMVPDSCEALSVAASQLLTQSASGGRKTPGGGPRPNQEVERCVRSQPLNHEPQLNIS